MKKKATEKQQVHKIIVETLRETIRLHGPIHSKIIGSAAKRIVGMLFKGKKNG